MNDVRRDMPESPKRIITAADLYADGPIDDAFRSKYAYACSGRAIYNLIRNLDEYREEK